MIFLFSFVLLSLGALQGVLVSFFLLRNKSKHPSHIFLVLFIIVITLQLAFKVISKGWLWHNVNLIYQLSYNLPYLAGPLFYLFIRRRVNKNPFKIIDSLHFLPFVLGSLTTFAHIFYNFPFLAWLPWNLVPWVVCHLSSLFIYGILSWRMLENKKTENGLKSFLIWVISSETIIIITMVLMVYNNGTLPDVRMLFIILTILIYWISYKLMESPVIFMSLPQGEIVPLRDVNTPKYAHSGLKADEANRIVTLLHEAIHHQKIFLEPDLSLDTLANKIDVPRHHLSRVINEQYGKTYVELANGWRLEEARSRLANPKFNHHTISTIALDSGFNSVSSFNTIFKRSFQTTPSKFREQNLKEMST